MQLLLSVSVANLLFGHIVYEWNSVDRIKAKRGHSWCQLPTFLIWCQFADILLKALYLLDISRRSIIYFSPTAKRKFPRRFRMIFHFCRTTNFSSLSIGCRIERSEDLSVLHTFVIRQKFTNKIAPSTRSDKGPSLFIQQVSENSWYQ